MKQKLTTRQYLTPFILITSLFFLWGFARAVLDVLNKHFQETLDISVTESSLIQVVTYLGYFLMAIPAGILIRKQGYKRGVLSGLGLFALGAFLFIPGSSIGTLSAFLICLFILACGLAILETAANPYSAALGPDATSSSRLNLSQSFNGLGSCLGPFLVGGFLFSGSGDVSIPYLVMGCVVVAIALVFSISKLPEITVEEDQNVEQTKIKSPIKALMRNKLFVLGASALLAYEVAEISINSYFINFATGTNVLDKMSAKDMLSAALFIFMGGRFIGAWIMQKISAAKVLYYCAVGTIVSMVGVIVSSFATSETSSWVRYLPLVFICFTYIFEAIMFPTIFSLAIKGLGSLTKTASSVLMMTPIGGCAFILVGIAADHFGYILPFIIPLLGYIVVFIYAAKMKKETSLKVITESTD